MGTMLDLLVKTLTPNGLKTKFDPFLYYGVLLDSSLQQWLMKLSLPSDMYLNKAIYGLYKYVYIDSLTDLSFTYW